MTLTLHDVANPIRVDSTGVARIGQTRVTLDTVVGCFLDGWGAEDIADAYPALDLAQVYTAISYYLQHRTEIDAYLNTRQEQATRVRAVIEERSNPKALRERLLARW